MTACIEWPGARTPTGYGRSGRDGYAHREAYERAKGPIPAGLEIDHLCWNRGCVNPDHLEAVTHRVNLLRGDTITARAAAATECPSGHPYVDGNIYRSGGHRYCRTCVLARVARRQRRMK